MRARQLHQDDEIARRVEARMQRQTVLAQEPVPQLWAIVDESALRKPVGGPQVMADQLRHIVDAAASPQIVVQVIPDSIGAHPGITSQFTVLDFLDPLDAPVVYIESSAHSIYLEEPADVARYGLIFQHLCGVALSPESSLAAISAVADRLEATV